MMRKYLLIFALSFLSISCGIQDAFKNMLKKTNVGNSSYLGTWFIPLNASSNEGVLTNHPELSSASNKNGFMAVTWARSNSSTGNNDIMVGIFNRGEWSFPADSSLRLNLNTGANSIHPKVAVNNNNQIAVVWKESGHLFKATYSDGFWSKPSSSSDFFTPTTFSINQFEIGLSSTGQIIVVYTMTISGHEQLFKSECLSSCSHPTSDTDYMSLNAGSVLNVGIKNFALKTSNNGDSVIAWTQDLLSDSTKQKILVAKKVSGTWAFPSESDAFSKGVSSLSELKMIINSFGNWILSWRENQSDITVIESFDGILSSPRTISLVTFGGDKHNLSINDNNEALVTWVMNDLIYRATRSQDGAWSFPLTIAESINQKTTGLVTGIPSSQLDNFGEAIISWLEEYDDSAGHITRQILKAEKRNGSWYYPSSIDQKITPDNFVGELCSTQQNSFIAMGDNHISTILISTGCSDSSTSGPFYKTIYK